MSLIIQRAKTIAWQAHGKQCRPNATHEPIAVHLAEVASYVADEANDPVAIAGAWLHDTVEDTDVTICHIRAELGDEIAQVVDALTDPHGWEAKPLNECKHLQAARIRRQSDRARLIKLADQLSNIRSVLLDPPLGWDREKSAEYINGALLVGNACAGVSARLDTILNALATDVASRAL